MTIGQDWKKRQQAQVQSAKQSTRQAQQAEADEAVAKIPALIETALEQKQNAVRTMPRNLRSDDITCGNVYDLAKTLESRSDLVAGDLTGVARFVFEWCDQNGLNCSLARVRDGEYALLASPK